MTPITLFQYIALALAGLGVGLILVAVGLEVSWLSWLVLKGLLREPTPDEIAERKALRAQKRTRGAR